MNHQNSEISDSDSPLPKIKDYDDFWEIARGPSLFTFAKFTKEEIKTYVPCI